MNPPKYGDMPVSDFRKYGHELIDWIADYFENIESYPVLSKVKPGDITKQLPDTPPETREKNNRRRSHWQLIYFKSPKA